MKQMKIMFGIHQMQVMASFYDFVKCGVEWLLVEPMVNRALLLDDFLPKEKAFAMCYVIVVQFVTWWNSLGTILTLFFRAHILDMIVFIPNS